LKNLSLSYNNIVSINEFSKFQPLDSLENLRIEGNPISNTYPNFIKMIISMLPSLRTIDGVSLSSQDRKEAAILYQK
jgi:hypothetical protein